MRRIDYLRKWLFSFCLLFLQIGGICLRAHNGFVEQLEFNRLSAFDSFSLDEVTLLFQDNKGYIWIATNSGLCRYDGYRIRTYKNNQVNPELLSDNQIRSIVEDHDHNIWIGTNRGLDILDSQTGMIRKIEDPVVAKGTIWALEVSRDNSVWVGLDNGLYQIKADRTTCIMYNTSASGIPLAGIKTILEDSAGRIWVGTWDRGLFRYDRQKGNFISYPVFNRRNSVHYLYEDSRQNLWAGTWEEGLFRLDDVEVPEEMTWVNYRNSPGESGSLADDIVYCIGEEPESRTLWVGTRSGLSILDLDDQDGGFINYLPGSEKYKFPYNELDGILRDRSGVMWLGMLGGGVYSVNTHRLPFEKGNLEKIKQHLFTPSVRSMLFDSEGFLWVGIGTYGVVLWKPGEKAPVFYTDIPDFKGQGHFLYTVNCMVERPSLSEIWFSSWGNGVCIYDKDAFKDKIRYLSTEDAPWLPNNMVFSMMRDRLENVWLGCQGGLAVYTAAGIGLNLSDRKTVDGELLNMVYYAMTETKEGTVWLGANEGIIRVEGSVNDIDRQQYYLYSSENGKLPYGRIRCLHVDRRGNIWAGSDGGGLMKYDMESDRFVSVSGQYGLLADAVFGIQEDNQGEIWLGTNSGLIRLAFSDRDGSGYSRVYSVNDGLLNNAFTMNATAKGQDGKLFFGGHNGFNSFYPEKIREEEEAPVVVITDMRIFNKSITELPDKERRSISVKPLDLSDRLVLKYNQNNFALEFSALSYKNPSQNKYAYKLEGYDAEWQYVGSSSRVANYSNLEAGVYLFYLKGSNGNGAWSEMERPLRIEILPPPWKSGWAYALYVCLALVGLYGGFYLFKRKMKRQQFRQLQEMEQAKNEEMNHAKLQFFTNITHELLTPLTILSALVEEMKSQASLPGDAYTVMLRNINRLIRLIQQILEFRKAESGNLKLKVSKGDVVDFIRKEVEAFQPLMKRKKMGLEFDCAQEGRFCYFDPDKLDKILYNLLSNASKYNREGGTVRVAVACGTSAEEVVISVKDDGNGLSEEMKKNLFKRFYEGDYRRFKTIGTGLGLSLTKDLVVLHGGTIRVESEVGKGCDFIVTIPVGRSAFSDDQVEEELIVIGQEDVMEGVEEEEVDIAGKREHSVLVVEDDEDLQGLIVKLLKRDYNVYTAANGVAAIELFKSKDREIDLVVSDVMMPEMNGVELCKYIKGHFDICHIPVLLLTAKNREEDRIEAYESGADGFIAKPFSFSLLCARIRNLLIKKERNAYDFKKQLVFEAKELDYTSLDEEFLQDAINCVQRHIDDSEFDQQRFLEEMNTSKSTLYKKLKSLTGLNTSGFIRNIRLKAACQIIEEKRHVRISELAYAVGFNDPKYFSVCFRKEFGMLPTEYMEQYAGGNVKEAIAEEEL